MTVEQRYSALLETREETGQDETLTGIEQAELIGRRYDALFGPWFHSNGLLKVDNNKDLAFLFDAASDAAFYTNAAKHTDQMSQVFAQLQRREQVLERQIRAMYGAYIAARAFAKAKEFVNRYPSHSLQPLPEVVERGALNERRPSVLQIGIDQKMLVRQSVDLDDDFQIFVISHPRCHFSQRAVRDIVADTVLYPLFVKYSKWIAPQDRVLPFGRFVERNRQYPQLPISIVYKQSEWPMIDDWPTPTFYFLRNGQVFAKVMGWPPEGRKAELIAAMEQAGIELPQAWAVPDGKKSTR